MKKKLYIQPIVETSEVQTTTLMQGLTVSVNSSYDNGGGIPDGD